MTCFHKKTFIEGFHLIETHMGKHNKATESTTRRRGGSIVLRRGLSSSIGSKVALTNDRSTAQPKHIQISHTQLSQLFECRFVGTRAQSNVDITQPGRERGDSTITCNCNRFERLAIGANFQQFDPLTTIRMSSKSRRQSRVLPNPSLEWSFVSSSK